METEIVLVKLSALNFLVFRWKLTFSVAQVVTPSNNVLVEYLAFKVEPGSNLLNTGVLWPLVSGRIAKPVVGSDLNKEVFYVPQRPHTAVGKLWEQLIYPLTADQESEPLTHSGMIALLENVGFLSTCTVSVDLEHLLDRYPRDTEVNWGEELSLGEQHQL
ncbi:hypothetical protein Cgig2_025914 [Carnegiea gigantea]|uniref:Uncharacterized protein n=1 Tax=Carnegiea gigantea TaxID=171969 RepID=A0A9Q1QCH2_9CARY|nr:hypothetical protein Cgig2_025914 [Carnegiea gigantea]